METNETVTTIFASSVKQAGWSMDRLVWRLRDTLRSIEWRGKDVCEVGCGRGDFAFYMALDGARRVVALEPSSAGSSSLKEAILKQRLNTLQLENFTFLPIRLEDYQFEPQSFDLVFGVQVIEHIHETKHVLSEDPEALAHYQHVFSIFYNMLRSGGVLVLTDCYRHNIWSFLSRYKIRPFLSHICWEIHQSPETYKSLAEEAGFERVGVHWRVPYQLRFAPWIADNYLFQFFTFASYILTAQRAGGA